MEGAAGGPIRSGASRRLRETGSVRFLVPEEVLATSYEDAGEPLPRPAAKAPAGEQPQASGQLGLADWMNLAYTMSTMWKSESPRRDGRDGAARLLTPRSLPTGLHPQHVYARENHHAVVYAEPALVAVFVLFVLTCASLGGFLLVSRVSCRPVDVDARAFSTNASANNYYGMTFVNNVCETELKVREDSGWTVLALVLICCGCGLLGVNKVLLDKFNRLHACARCDWGAAAFAKEPPSVREVKQGPSLFHRFALLAVLLKTACAAGGSAAYGWYVLDMERREIGRHADGTFAGGSLLTRYGGECDGSRIRYEDPFPGTFRCHIEREPVMMYLKASVYVVGAVLMLTQLAMVAGMVSFWHTYVADVRAEALEKARAEKEAEEDAALGVDAAGEGAREWQPTADEASLVRALRVTIRLGMGYLAQEPREGLPELLAQIIVGKAPSKRELAHLTGHLLALKDAPSDEVAELLYAVLQKAMSGGMDANEAAKDLLRAACIAWSDGERQKYMRGMLDLLEQQERAKAQTDALPRGGSGSVGRAISPTRGALLVSRTASQSSQGSLR